MIFGVRNASSERLSVEVRWLLTHKESDFNSFNEVFPVRLHCKTEESKAYTYTRGVPDVVPTCSPARRS